MYRQLLESFAHEHCSFVTLTYRDEDLPTGSNLVPRDLSLWLKRIRKAVSPRPLRFYAAGEYGFEGSRGINPHYHVSLFGLSGHTDEHGSGNRRFYTYAGEAEIVQETWGLGQTFTREFNARTALYTCGYVVKKMTAADDPRLNGLHPEFGRMSLRPHGIGAEAIPMMVQMLSTPEGSLSIERQGDVPRQLKMARKALPLDRYMLSKLREGIGFTPEHTARVRHEIRQETHLEMLSLLDVALSDPSRIPSQKEVYLKECRQRLLNAESEFRIWSKKRETLEV